MKCTIKKKYILFAYTNNSANNVGKVDIYNNNKQISHYLVSSDSNPGSTQQIK